MTTSTIIRSTQLVNEKGISSLFTLVQFYNESLCSYSYQVTRITFVSSDCPTMFTKECDSLGSALNVFHNLQISYLV